MTNNNEWIVFDGDLIPAEQPVVPAVSRGLMYGDGLFETIRTYSGQTLFFDEHINRLQRGMDTLGIPNSPDLNQVRLKTFIARLIAKNNLSGQDAIIRLQVWRDGQRGYEPEPDAETHLSITTSACPDHFSFPSLATVDRRRIPTEALPSTAKFTNGINYILAAREASESNADDALMQTVDGWVSETTIANVFWAHENTIFTPSVDCDLVPGITRQILIDIIRGSKNYQLERGEFPPQKLFAADVVWICNSVRELLPVRQIDDIAFSTKSTLLSDLQHRFETYRNKNLELLPNQ